MSHVAWPAEFRAAVSLYSLLVDRYDLERNEIPGNQATKIEDLKVCFCGEQRRRVYLSYE